MEPSGRQWCSRFMGSVSIDALAEPFQGYARAFVNALLTAGASVSISATFRPPERAYLMHWCWAIAEGAVMPADVPPMAGVDIDWTHGGDYTGARLAAVQMKEAYALRVQAVLESRHTLGQAIDMTISWRGQISVKDARGIEHPCTTQEELWPIGASFKVKKLVNDEPHWSLDGH